MPICEICKKILPMGIPITFNGICVKCYNDGGVIEGTEEILEVVSGDSIIIEIEEDTK